MRGARAAEAEGDGVGERGAAGRPCGAMAARTAAGLEGAESSGRGRFVPEKEACWSITAPDSFHRTPEEKPLGPGASAGRSGIPGDVGEPDDAPDRGHEGPELDGLLDGVQD